MYVCACVHACLTRAAGGLLELLGRQNSPTCTFVIGCAGSGKTQLLLALARQCAGNVGSDSLCLVPVFLKPGLVADANGIGSTSSRFVEELLASAVQAAIGGNGMTHEDISSAVRATCSDISVFASTLVTALLALFPSRRLLLFYDANDAAAKGDLAALVRACKAGCHVIITGQDDSLLDAWAMEDCNSSARTARASPSLKLSLLQPPRHTMSFGGVVCDPASLLGARACAGVDNWWLLHNSVRHHMLSTPHNRYIASGRIPPFGPALRLQTWNRVIFDCMNWDTTRPNAHTLLFADTAPGPADVAGECVRDILLLLGRISFAHKSSGKGVTDSTFIAWLLAMPTCVGVTAHEASLVMRSLKRSGASPCVDVMCVLRVTPGSGLLVSEATTSESSSDACFRLCCHGIADATLSLLASTRISAKIGALWAFQSDTSAWSEVLSGAWLYQSSCREWLVYTFLQLKEPLRQRAIMACLSSNDPSKADASIIIQAYSSILKEQMSLRENGGVSVAETASDVQLDGIQALLVPVIDCAQRHFYLRACELARQPWWDAAAQKGVLNVSWWVQDVIIDVIDRLNLDNTAILIEAASALSSPKPSMSMKIGAACTLGRIKISPSSVSALFQCVAESGVNEELRKHCMMSLLCISTRLQGQRGDDALGAKSKVDAASNMLIVAAVRFACDVDKDVSRIARCICEQQLPRLISFIVGSETPHSLAKLWLVSGDSACASASAASTVASFQGNEAVVGALLQLLKRGDKVASISAASALSAIADPSMRVVQECTEAFLSQHCSGQSHWSAARQVLAKTLCVLVTRSVCPAAICSMCDVVVNGLEKVLGIKDRDAELQEVAMTASLSDLLHSISLASQDQSRRYIVVDSESEMRNNDPNETFIMRHDMIEAKRLAIHVIGRHVAVHGWIEGLLGLSDGDRALQNAVIVYDAALDVITATAMSDNHDLQPDALASALAFLRLKAAPPSATRVALWMKERLTRDTEALHDFMNSAPSEADTIQQRSAPDQGGMDSSLKDMFLPADMRLQSVLVTRWQSAGQSAWLQLLMRCKLFLGALRCEFLGTDTTCVSDVFDLCAFALQKLSHCLDLYDLPVKRIQLVDTVLNFWTTINSCSFNSKCSSLWAVAILSTSNSLTFGTVSPPSIPRFPSLIDQRVVDSVKAHLFLACESIRERPSGSHVFNTFADLKHELWLMIMHLAANDSSTLHRAQWQRAAVAIALQADCAEWTVEARGVLLSGLMDPTKVVRLASAELFGTFLDNRVELLHSLQPYMASKSPDCRLRGIEASLVLFASPVNGVKEALPSGIETYISLLSSMLDDENVAVRCAVIDALAHVDSQGVYFRKILQMLDDPAAEIRLASARVIVSKKLRDVGVASVILGAIAPGKTRSATVRMAELHAIEAISQVGANNPQEWAALLRCIGIASSDISENMSLVASSSLATGTGLNIRSAHAAMDIIPLLEDSSACGPAVQLLGSFCERFCCFPPDFYTPVPRFTSTAAREPAWHASYARLLPHLDTNIRALPAACCRGISEAVARLGLQESPAPAYEPLVLWWFCRVHGLIPCSDADFRNALRWAAEI